MLTIVFGSFLLTVRAFFSLTVGAFLLTIEALRLQWESVSSKQLELFRKFFGAVRAIFLGFGARAQTTYLLTFIEPAWRHRSPQNPSGQSNSQEIKESWNFLGTLSLLGAAGNHYHQLSFQNQILVSATLTNPQNNGKKVHHLQTVPGEMLKSEDNKHCALTIEGDHSEHRLFSKQKIQEML